MKNFIKLFSLIVLTVFASCQKETALSTTSNPFETEQRIQSMVDAAVDPSMPVLDEPLIITDEQIRVIAENQSFWTYDELKQVINDNRSSFQDKYAFLKSKLPNDRAENEETLETFCKRSYGYFTDSNPNHLAQVLAASGTIVGTRSSLNVFRPINDNGAVTYTDIYVSTIRQAVTSADQIIEYLPSTIVWEYEVSGGNWLIGVDIVTHVGVITDTIHYCGDCPNGQLIWNPTLSSPVDDDVIEGALPFNVYQISANGLTPPPPVN